jgi:hypothetical protein
VLRKLGHPVIKVRVTDEQLDDRVDEALNKFLRQHYDGSEKVYLAHQLTAGEVSTKSITLDDTILGVIDVFQLGFSTGLGSASLHFNVPYQILMSEVFSTTGGGVMTAGGLPSYVAMRMSLEEISQFLVGKFPFRYSEKTDELFLDVAPEKLVEGNYVVIEAYRLNDPEDYPDVWGDLWLQRYAAALVKKQWGQNLSTITGAQLPGGIAPNGTAIKMEAETEINELEDELIRTYSPILHDMIG